MSEKRKGLFNRMFSPNGDSNDEEPSADQVRRWLNEPDGRPGYRPQRPYQGGSPSAPSGSPFGGGGAGGQQQAFRDLAQGFGRPQPGSFTPEQPSSGYTPPQADQWNPRTTRPSGEWTPPAADRWTPPQAGGWAPQNMGNDDEGGGVEVGEVGQGGPLAQAGVRAGDVIVAVDGRDVDSEEDLFAALGSLLPGRTAVLEIVRGDNRLTTTVVAPR